MQNQQQSADGQKSQKYDPHQTETGQGVFPASQTPPDYGRICAQEQKRGSGQ